MGTNKARVAKARRNTKRQKQQRLAKKLEDRGFVQGVAYACAERLRGQSVEEVLDAAGLGEAELAAAGVAEYDLEPIRAVLAS